MSRILEIFKKTFPRFVMAIFILEIEKHLKDCVTVLDVGCGNDSPLKLINDRYQTVGVEGYKPAIEESKRNNIHSKYIVGDINKLGSMVKKKSFDVAIALDVIEHLEKKDGYRLLENMERAARKRVILVTPNGFIPQFNKDNKLQAHLSGWSVKDFEERGYKVEGIYGTKLCNVFRSEEAELRFRPKVFWKLVWGVLVTLSHYLYTKRNPESSISLLAVKDLS